MPLSKPVVPEEGTSRIPIIQLLSNYVMKCLKNAFTVVIDWLVHRYNNRKALCGVDSQRVNGHRYGFGTVNFNNCHVVVVDGKRVASTCSHVQRA